MQTTQDLRSFWERTYPEVRKELAGPLSETPVARGSVDGARTDASDHPPSPLSSWYCLRSHSQSFRSWLMRRLHVAMAVAVLTLRSVRAHGVYSAAGRGSRGAAAAMVGQQGQARPVRQEQGAHQARRSEGAPQRPGELDRSGRGRRELPFDVQPGRTGHEDHARGCDPTRASFSWWSKGRCGSRSKGSPSRSCAKRGSVVNIPKKTMYSAEVIGTRTGALGRCESGELQDADARYRSAAGAGARPHGDEDRPQRRRPRRTRATTSRTSISGTPRRIRSSPARTSCRTTTCGRRRSGDTRRTCRPTMRTTKGTSTSGPPSGG